VIAPNPDTIRPEPIERPLVTFRVVIRDTDAVLRRSRMELAPRFGRADLFKDDIADFPSEAMAEAALSHVLRHFDSITDRKIVLCVKPYTNAGLSPAGENSLLCRIRDTMVALGNCELLPLSNRHLGLIGVEK
jgi:hypothetical protein